MQYNVSIISGLTTTFTFITSCTAITVQLKLSGNLDKTEQTQRIAFNTSTRENNFIQFQSTQKCKNDKTNK